MSTLNRSWFSVSNTIGLCLLTVVFLALGCYSQRSKTVDNLNKADSESPALRGKRNSSGNCEIVGKAAAQGTDQKGRTHVGYRFDENCNAIPLDEEALRALEGQEGDPVESREASSGQERPE